jgi:hypothetical protein
METIKWMAAKKFEAHEPEQFREETIEEQEFHLKIFLEVRAKYLVIIEFRKMKEEVELRKK